MSGHGAEVEVPRDENDPFVKRVALSVAVFAVVLAVAAAGGNNAGKDMMMYQMKASNEWSQYQSKRQREVAYETEKEALDQQFGSVDPPKDAQKERGKQPTDPTERRKARQRYVTAKLVEYQDDKGVLAERAKGYEADRDTAHKKDPFFDMAELLLQIGIVLASVAMLSKARWAFLGGCVLAVGGLALTVLGYFFPDVPVPFVSDGGTAPAGH